MLFRLFSASPTSDPIAQCRSSSLDLRWFEEVPSCWMRLVRRCDSTPEDQPKRFIQWLCLQNGVLFVFPSRLVLSGFILLSGLVCFWRNRSSSIWCEHNHPHCVSKFQPKSPLQISTVTSTAISSKTANQPCHQPARPLTGTPVWTV